MRAWLKKQGFKKGDLRSYIKAYPCMHPMGHACFMGELHICKWLFDNGAADDITRVSDMYDNTPLHLASHGGHLSVCQWLHKVGAAGDIPFVKVGAFGTGHFSPSGTHPMARIRVYTGVCVQEWFSKQTRLCRRNVPTFVWTLLAEKAGPLFVP